MLVSVLFIFGLHAHPLGIIHSWTTGFPAKNTKNTEDIYIKPSHRKNGICCEPWFGQLIELDCNGPVFGLVDDELYLIRCL